MNSPTDELGCIHDLSYLLKTDDKGNYVAVVHQLPSVIVQSKNEQSIHEKVEKATTNHLKVYHESHERIKNDTSSRIKDTTYGRTVVESKHFKVKC